MMGKNSLIITTYERPQYLLQCLNSIKRSDLSNINVIYIIDDASKNQETIRLIKEFDLPSIEIVKVFKNANKSIKHSLLTGYNLSIMAGCEIFINIDADAIVSFSWIKTLLGLKEQFPDNIVSGFNTTVKNRNPIIEEHPTYFKKKYASGINMVINKDQYEDYLLPALSMPIGNFDFEASKLHMADGKAVIVAKPSVVQHIGIEESSMGHISANEPPDVAEDFIDDNPDHGTRLYVREDNRGNITHAKLLLPKITLIAVDDNLEGIIKAADISCRFIGFNCVKLLSSMPSDDPRVIQIRKLGSKKEYSQFLLKEIVDYIDTPYFIVIQSDGFLINWQGWSDEFYDVDMVGALWSWYPDGHRCCNGGCSMRSRRLHQVTKDDDFIVLRNDHIITNYAEDHNLGRIYRSYLEKKHGIRFAPDYLCDKFSTEGWMKPPPTNKYNGSFGFHGYGVDFNEADLPYIPYKLPNRKIL